MFVLLCVCTLSEKRYKKENKESCLFSLFSLFLCLFERYFCILEFSAAFSAWARQKLKAELSSEKEGTTTKTRDLTNHGIPRPRTKEEIGSRARGGGENKTGEYALVRAHVWDGFVLRESERE